MKNPAKKLLLFFALIVFGVGGVLIYIYAAPRPVPVNSIRCSATRVGGEAVFSISNPYSDKVTMRCDSVDFMTAGLVTHVPFSTAAATPRQFLTISSVGSTFNGGRGRLWTPTIPNGVATPSGSVIRIPLSPVDDSLRMILRVQERTSFDRLRDAYLLWKLGSRVVTYTGRVYFITNETWQVVNR